MTYLPKLGTKPIPMFPSELPDGVEQVDFVYISGDAYVDHPSFGTAIISRILEDAGFSVGIIVGTAVVSAEEDSVGETVGTTVGVLVGVALGVFEGATETVGAFVGVAGLFVGVATGVGVAGTSGVSS